ncbi:MAG: molecular chaperone DnaK [Patescibacteria group bacterium]|jgi:molecular chaperone DnaK|nr:molecular chaperone DnaK [Patescibacteria group bacterium]
MGKILGIDLGTTNSAMAIIEAGQPKIIENKEGMRTTPSIVAIAKNGERLVGVLAKRQAITNPQNTIFSIKRLIGRKYTDPEVQRDKKWLPYEIRESASGGVEVKMGDKWHRPEEISAMILQKLKLDAEEKLGEKIEEAIITVPAYFDDSQRQATKNAGEIAGFKVRRILNEPTAAALAYGLNKKKNERVVVYDFGGGTFDISVLEVSEDTIEVLVTGGDTHLGGDDFDQRIINYFVDEFKKKEGIDLSKDSLALQRLKEAAERAKHELSTVLETEVNLPFITSDASGPKHFEMKLTRAKLEELVKDYIDRSIELVKKTLAEKNLKVTDIDEVILVGGQTRMPAMQEAVKNLFGKEPHKGINPDEVVAMGAAVEAGVLQGEVRDILLLDVTPLSLGIETLGGVFTKIIEKNTTVPVAKTQIFSTATDNQTSVEIHVLQGEREMAADNKTLARFILDGIPPAPRGVPQIEVTFDIDANGILKVIARDKATGKEQSVRIEASTGLSKEEIERMKKEAEMHLEEDRKKKELAEAKNQAENLIYVSEKTLREGGDKVSSEERKEIEEKINDLKDAIKNDDINRIKTATQNLSLAIQKIGAKMYQGGQGDNQSSNQQNNDNPQDAEFKEQ